VNWWVMRLACNSSGSADPSRLLALKALGFRDTLELHLAQDALDALSAHYRRQREEDRS